VRGLATILWLGLKELRSLSRDVVLVIFVAYAFTLAILSQARGTSSEVHNASIAFVDEDRSPLSRQLAGAFLPPGSSHRVRSTRPRSTARSTRAGSCSWS